MKNRGAWGLAAVLAVVVLGGIAGLFAPSVILLPRQEWGVGQSYIKDGEMIAPSGQHGLVIIPCFKVWLLAIRHRRVYPTGPKVSTP